MKISTRQRLHESFLSRKYWYHKDKHLLPYIKNAEHILDVGCGESITVEWLCNKYPEKHIKGIDIDKEKITNAERVGLPVQYGDCYSIPYPDVSQDVVIFSEVLEHLKLPDNALTEIYRVLKPNGKLLMIAPNDDFFYDVRYYIGQPELAEHNYGHIYKWKPKELNELLIDNNFKIEKGKCIPFYIWGLSLHYFVVAKKR